MTREQFRYNNKRVARVFQMRILLNEAIIRKIAQEMT